MAKILIIAPPAIFAITCHEVAHGWVASRFGDPTARDRGRLTLNPIAHVDPMGTLVVPLVLALANAPIIGWAKPVPVDFRKLRDPKKQMGYVAGAGPATNLLLAAISGFLYHLVSLALGDGALSSFLSPLRLMLLFGVQVNVMLAIFNLLPIPPMDGSKVAISVLPLRYARIFVRMESYGIFPLLLLLLIPETNRMIGRVINPVSGVLIRLFLEGPASLF